MKACNDLEFLGSYWKEAINVAYKIKQDLPQLSKQKNIKEISGKLQLIKYSDIKDSWSVKDLIPKYKNRSNTLEILSNKISNMILKGDAQNVKPMLNRIVNKGVKNLKQPGYSKTEWTDINGNEKCKNLGNIGKGHFRWNYQAYKLNNKEIQHLKKYFKL